MADKVRDPIVFLEKKNKKKSQVMYIRAAIENKSAGGNN